MNIFQKQAGVQRVILIGCGFGGLEFSKRLKTGKYELLVLDKNNYFTFQPLLYQVATGGLEPDSVAYPIRKLFRDRKRISFRMAEVLKIHPEERSLSTSIGTLPFDVLVIAAGAATNYYNLPGVQEHGLSMKSLREALDLRSSILKNFEDALLEPDPSKKEALLHFVVAGGGPTGVEIAGALAELRKVLPPDYPELDFTKMKITLLEGAGKILSAFNKDSSRNAMKQLEDMQVEIILNTQLKSFDGEKALLSDGSTIRTKSLIWTAGVKANPVQGLIENSLTRSGKIRVDAFNRMVDSENIYAIGDVTQMEEGNNVIELPKLAPVAIQQAKNLAVNLNRSSPGLWKKFSYKDRGSMATIGRSRAVADIGSLHLKGSLAWFAWLFIHLILLIGFRNRMVVFINWMWNYFSYDRAIRLILEAPKSKKGTI